MAKLIPQGSHAEPLSIEFKEGLISHKNVCLWKPSFPYHYPLECLTAILSGFPGLSVSSLRLVQELLGEYRCKYDLGLFLLWSWPPVIDTDTLAIWLALPAAGGHLTIAASHLLFHVHTSTYWWNCGTTRGSEWTWDPWLTHTVLGRKPLGLIQEYLKSQPMLKPQT